jgi:hypothetical protein
VRHAALTANRLVLARLSSHQANRSGSTPDQAFGTVFVVRPREYCLNKKKGRDVYKHEVHFSNLAATEPFGGVGVTSRTDDPSNPYQLVFSTDEKLTVQDKKNLIETLEVGKALWNVSREADQLPGVTRHLW